MVRTCPISLRWPPVQRSQREADSGFRIKSLDGRETVISASQCRSTLEALAEIKARPVFIARRANIVHGPQQVNNGVAANNAQTPARAEQTESAKSELLEARPRGEVNAPMGGQASPITVSGNSAPLAERRTP